MMVRIYILLASVLSLIGCNYKSHSKSLKTALSENEIILDSTYKLKLVTKSDTLNGRDITQMLLFFEKNKQIKQVNPKSLSFLKNTSLIQQFARIKLNSKLYYLLYVFTANGEPEFYITYDPTGNLVAYNKCTRDNCETKIIAKDIDSIATRKFFQNEDNIEFVNINY
jgi:hypothetical protein